MPLSLEQQLRRAALQTAYDQLIAGERVAKVSSGGRSVDYAAADVSRLRGELDALDAAARPAGRTRGAVGFRF